MRRIVIVHEDETLARYLLSFFQRKGYAVDLLDPAEAGPGLMEEGPPDLVIGHVRTLTGRGWLTELTRAAAGRGIPVLLLVQHRRPDRDETRETAPDATLLLMPFTPEELGQTVEDLLGKRGDPASVPGLPAP